MTIQTIGNGVSKIGAKASAAVIRAHRLISKGTEIAVTFVLQRAGINIEQCDARSEEHLRSHMIVLASCGRMVGFVDEVAEDSIKLFPIPGEYRQPIIIPWDWIGHIESCVYLNRDYEEATRNN